MSIILWYFSMWPITSLIPLLGIQLPIIQAPMAGGATTPELVAAISHAGGLGSLGAGYMLPEDIRTAIKKIRALSNKPFAVNLFIPQSHHATEQQIATMKDIIEKNCTELNLKLTDIKPPYLPSFNEQLKIAIEEKVPILSFTFGIPEDNYLIELKKNKIILIGTATTLAEAKLLEEKGIDLIVAQGNESGGHRGTFLGNVEDALIGNFALIPQLADTIKVPIVAAGGIMDARGIVASLILGASGVQMGTAFLSCQESGAHQMYKQALLNTKQDNTTLTRSFSGKHCRMIKNTFIKRMETYSTDLLDYPIQHTLTALMRKEAARQNQVEFLSLLAGQAAYLCKDISATQLINELNNDVKSLLKKL